MAASQHGKGAERLHAYLTDKAVEEEIAGLEDIASRGWRISGQSTLKRFKLQYFNKRDRKLTAYACVDLSAARVIDDEGKDVTPKSRANLQTSLPSFAYSEGTMKMVQNGTWSGKSIC